MVRHAPVTTVKLALVLEYDGKRYRGFQVQRIGPTIQGELEQAIARITGRHVRVTGAGRTDAGVHALGQVVSFAAPESRLDADTWVRALNFYLPEDIAIVQARAVEDGFDARRGALSRTYRYRIVNRPVRSPLRRDCTHHVADPLDAAAMAAASRALVGEHDFLAFAATGWAGKSTVRRVYRAEADRHGDEVTIEVEANGFLLHQVRRIAGTLIRVGSGRLDPDEVRRILVERDHESAGPTAPAHGLCLMAVTYPAGYGLD